MKDLVLIVSVVVLSLAGFGLVVSNHDKMMKSVRKQEIYRAPAVISMK